MIGKQISVQELSELIKNGLPADSIIIDVRTPDEFSSDAIAGAKNIPLDQVVNQESALLNYKKIYLYCRSGGRSQLALAQLEAKKLPVELYNVTGGILAWKKLS